MSVAKIPPVTLYKIYDSTYRLRLSAEREARFLGLDQKTAISLGKYLNEIHLAAILGAMAVSGLIEFQEKHRKKNSRTKKRIAKPAKGKTRK